MGLSVVEIATLLQFQNTTWWVSWRGGDVGASNSSKSGALPSPSPPTCFPNKGRLDTKQMLSMPAVSSAMAASDEVSEHAAQTRETLVLGVTLSVEAAAVQQEGPRYTILHNEIVSIS